METVAEPEKRTITKDIPADDDSAPALKKQKTENADARDIRHGVAPVKPEFLVERRARDDEPVDDDAAEASRHTEGNTAATAETGRKSKQRGQNKGRKFHFAKDEVKLCASLARVKREGLFESTICDFAVNGPRAGNNKRGRGGRRGGRGGRGGATESRTDAEEDGQPEARDDVLLGNISTSKKCDLEHNLRAYLASKRPDVEGVCPVWEFRGICAGGWRCRWLGSHMKEENGELMLVEDEAKANFYATAAAEARKRKIETSKVPDQVVDCPQDWEKDVRLGGFDDPYGEVVNNIPMDIKIALRKDQFPLKKSKEFQVWADQNNKEQQDDEKAAYVEAPLRAEEKRKLYIGRNTPLLAPLTTTGNLPFRRLCASFGATITYSEMAMSSSLLSGHKPEWALMRAHSSELPTFGAQIAANKLGQAIRATEALTTLFPSAASGRYGLALVDLNCGCPIDLVYRHGGGSALLDTHGKLAKILKGMNHVSGETPITCKIRMGTKDNTPTAQKLVQRLVREGDVQAITLHGRSRQQRYTRAADWEYIAETAALIKSVKEQQDLVADTANDKEMSEKRNMYFVGNGDCYSHADYFSALDNSGVDSVMVARGALIKPWVFEEIEKGQYLDKSSSQRLDMLRDYCKYGLENWGSDELGIASTRRFLLEFLSFHHRYVPVGILERLPPRLQDRPPVWRGRDDMETLLGSTNYKDWIKISDMFLGPCPDDFHFTPKHKSNTYEAEG